MLQATQLSDAQERSRYSTRPTVNIGGDKKALAFISAQVERLMLNPGPVTLQPADFLAHSDAPWARSDP